MRHLDVGSQYLFILPKLHGVSKSFRPQTRRLHLLHWAWGRKRMRRDPDTEDSDLDETDDDGSSPLEVK
jgi:hypothetical protein